MSLVLFPHQIPPSSSHRKDTQPPLFSVSAFLLVQALKFSSLALPLVAHAFNASTWEAETVGSL